MGYSEEQIKACEDYLKSTTHCKIVKAFGNYIVLANDESDYNSKCNRISRGETFGFYVIERVLQLLNKQ